MAPSESQPSLPFFGSGGKLGSQECACPSAAGSASARTASGTRSVAQRTRGTGMARTAQPRRSIPRRSSGAAAAGSCHGLAALATRRPSVAPESPAAAAAARSSSRRRSGRRSGGGSGRAAAVARRCWAATAAAPRPSRGPAAAGALCARWGRPLLALECKLLCAWGRADQGVATVRVCRLASSEQPCLSDCQPPCIHG